MRNGSHFAQSEDALIQGQSSREGCKSFAHLSEGRTDSAIHFTLQSLKRTGWNPPPSPSDPAALPTLQTPPARTPSVYHLQTPPARTPSVCLWHMLFTSPGMFFCCVPPTACSYSSDLSFKITSSGRLLYSPTLAHIILLFAEYHIILLSFCNNVFAHSAVI